MPGHWEGDLIIGTGRSAIGTIVERSSRSTLLVHLPRLEGWGEKPPVNNDPPLGGYGAIAMNTALTASLTTLPEQLRKTLTWDRGKELSGHAQFTLDTDTTVPTCPGGRPRTWKPSPWRSTTAPARSSAGAPRPKSSPNSYAHYNNPVLHRPVEPAQYTSVAFTTRLIQAGVDPSVGSVGDALDNALAETTVGSLKNELIWREGPWRDVEHVEIETLNWVDWFNNDRPHNYVDDLTPVRAEQLHYIYTSTPAPAG